MKFTSKKTGTRDLLLTEIEDLQSSLMLLGREARGGAENHDEAEMEKTIFVQVRFSQTSKVLGQGVLLCFYLVSK